MPELPERVARLEQHIASQNGALQRIEGKQDKLDEKLDKLGEDVACFKGVWTAVTVIFSAIVATVAALFGKKLGS